MPKYMDLRFDTPDRLRSTINILLTAGQVTQAEPLIRQYMEYKRQQVIRKVGISVPIDFAMKDTSQMVQNCIDAITAAVDLHKSAGSLVLDSAGTRSRHRARTCDSG
jgi:hypothetical protein